MGRAERWLTIVVAVSATVLFGSISSADAEGPEDFTLVEVITNLDRPTAVEIAPNGDVFVTEKNGKLKVFDGLDDPTADVVVDWQSRTMATGDQGMLGLAVDPLYGNGRNYVYVHYVLDEIPGENDPPHWNDNCPVSQTDGCVVTASLARIEVDPATNQMVDWIDLLTSASCFQFNGHSSNDLSFGPDGFLYALVGDGASFTVADYGQLGTNPCEDPPYPDAPTPANGQGGALRTMDLLTSVGGETNDPVWYNGVVLRIDPDTGAAAPGNPLAGGAVGGDDRIIAHGMRNPFRMDVRPGTDELWISDVGWGQVEEINVVADVDDATVENFGWPCYEGPTLHPVYSQYGFCQTIVNDPGSLDLTTDLTQARYPYTHQDTVGDCGPGGSAATAVAFGRPGQYPEKYHDALFFNDYARGCLWAMLADANGVPDPTTIDTLVTDAIIVDLEVTPNGDLLVVEVGDFTNGSGRIRRLDFLGGNLAPSASITANTLTGTENVTLFEFSGAGSTDPEGEALTYEWDLDGDDVFDAAGETASIVYTDPGSYTVTLRVTDPGGASDETTVIANVSNTPPQATIDSPAAATTWRVGDEISFSGTATDAEDGALAPDTPGAEWQWTLILHHCPDVGCHTHIEGSWSGVSSGTFATPDHEYPSYLELRLVVTDSVGATDTASVELQPITSIITLDTDPTGLEVAGGIGAGSQVAPFDIEAIEGGDVSVVAPSPQTLGSTPYAFESWSDGGARSHDIVVPSGDLTLTASFTPVQAGFQDGWTGVAPSGGWSYWWNETGPLGDSSGYSALQWNGAFYDGDGVIDQPAASEFSYGAVLVDRVHPGRSALQGAADDRFVIIRYEVDVAGAYAIVSSSFTDLDCASGGVELVVLVNDVVVSSQMVSGSALSSFDQSLGVLAPTNTIDVAVGPGTSDECDTSGLDFFISQGEPTSGSVIATFSEGFSTGSPTGAWSYLWNESSALGTPSGYRDLQWNSVFYDSDGVLPGASPDEFSYGNVASWGAHPGRSASQASGVDRHAIIQYEVTADGTYAIADSFISNRGCLGGGVELTVLADDRSVSVIDFDGIGSADFDTVLGLLASGDTIQVAVGPGPNDACDAVDLDFSIEYIASGTEVVTATYSDDFTGPSPGSGWSYLWNENGAIGDSAGYSPLTWNTIHYDSDGLIGGSTNDEFSYGLAAQWGLHPGRGISQSTTDDRFAIVRHTISSGGSYRITGSSLANRGCVGQGVELQIRVNDVLISSTDHAGSDPASFDTALGNLAPGDTVDVAVGPDRSNVCDAVDLDFSLTRGAAAAG